MRRRIKLLTAAAIALGIVLAAPLLLRPTLALLDRSEPPPCVLSPGRVHDPTANAACIVEDGDSLLLVRTLRSGNWGLPGGRRKRDEASQCTAHRETWEETGVLVEVGPLVGKTESTRIYACNGDPDPPQQFMGPRPWLSRIEILEHRWVPKSELGKLEWRYDDQKSEVLRVLGNPERIP